MSYSEVVVNSGTHEFIQGNIVFLKCPLSTPIFWSKNNETIRESSRSRFFVVNGTLRVVAIKDEKIQCGKCQNPENCAEVFDFHLKMINNYSADFCNNHGICQRFISEFGVETVQCECEHGFQGEFCDEPGKTKLKLAVVFWIIIVIEIGLLIVAVVRHRKQTIFRFQDKNHLRFVDILNGALQKTSNSQTIAPPVLPENDAGPGNQVVLEQVQNADQNPVPEGPPPPIPNAQNPPVVEDMV